MPINTRLFPGNNPTTKEGFKRWLDEVAKYSTDEDFDPILLPKKTANGYVNEDGTPYKEFDYMSFVPGFESLSANGDRRYTLGHMVSSAFSKYLPKILLYAEIAQAGGCQVIGEYICDADGTPIKKATNVCEGLDLNIDPNEVISFVRDTFANKKQEDIKAFADFLRKNYVNSGYVLSLITLSDIPLFFAKLQKQNDIKYFRYHYDDREAVARELGVAVQKIMLVNRLMIPDW